MINPDNHQHPPGTPDWKVKLRQAALELLVRQDKEAEARRVGVAVAAHPPSKEPT